MVFYRIGLICSFPCRHCDPACNTPLCADQAGLPDGGDCDGVSTCAGEGVTICPTGPNIWGYGGDVRGDCICDQNCNVPECDMDGRDC
eukprot:SAG31_NODE_2620_length_5364_cov_27.556315_1_plen_87_part_10